MKSKKIQQSLIKVVFIKEFAGHAIGNIIATDTSTVNFLINKGVAEKCDKAILAQENKIDKVPAKIEAKPGKKVEEQQKPKGRPSKK